MQLLAGLLTLKSSGADSSALTEDAWKIEAAIRVRPFGMACRCYWRVVSKDASCGGVVSKDASRFAESRKGGHLPPGRIASRVTFVQGIRSAWLE